LAFATVAVTASGHSLFCRLFSDLFMPMPGTLGLPGATGRELVSVGIKGGVEGVEIVDGAITFTALNEILKARKEAEKQAANKSAHPTAGNVSI
jgi:TctA family transporter